jgi:hypothetical protein
MVINLFLRYDGTPLISLRTIQGYVQTIDAKRGVRARTEAVTIALETAILAFPGGTRADDQPALVKGDT